MPATWNEWILFKFVIYPLSIIFLGADVHAKDKGGLVPLHNACSYGHYEVTELLVKHGASVNVCDLWRFTPLHEGSAKGKYEIVKLLLKHGADPTKKNRDGHTPMDLVKEGNTKFIRKWRDTFGRWFANFWDRIL